MFHLDIYQLAALCADRVVVPVRHPVKAAGAIAKLYLSDVSSIFQISQTVVNSRKTYARQHVLRRRKYLIRRQMLPRITDHLQHNLTLLC